MKKVVRYLLPILFLFVFFAIIGYNSGSLFGYKFNKTEISSSQDSSISKSVTDQFTLEDIKILFPNVASYSVKAVDKAIVYDANNQILGEAYHTLPKAKDIRGFADVIPLIIGCDNNKQIIGIAVQKNNETPAFINRVISTGLLDKWKGKLASDAVTLNIDAVTGATMSSSCIINSIKTRLASSVEEIAKEKEEQAKFYKELSYEILAWICLLISIAAYFKQTSFGKYRKFLIVLFVIIPGFILGRFVSLGLLKAWVSNGIPYSTQIFMTVLVLLAIFLPMITGRAFYCVWYCPFGAAQEVFGMFIKYKYTPKFKVANILKWTRPTLLFLILVLLLFKLNIDIYEFEPFSAFMFKSASVFVLSLAIVFLILSVFIRRPWCNYFCPTGQFLETCRRKKTTIPTKKD